MDYDDFSSIIKASKHLYMLTLSFLTLSKQGTISFGDDEDYRIK